MGLYGGGPDIPEPDQRIGEAAMMSARTGAEYLRWMSGQAARTNRWADTDRARYEDTFIPLENQWIEEAQGYDTAARRRTSADEAAADVQKTAQAAEQTRQRQMAAMGIDPRSGRYQAGSREQALRTGLAEAGARNNARKMVAERGRELRASAVNMGKGLAVNPATSAGLATSAQSAGFQGAMSGYGQQGSLLNTQYGQQMDTWRAQQAQTNSMMGGLGSLAGFAMTQISSEDAKTGKRKARGLLDEVRDMPVKDWRYKDGVGDGGAAEHTGPMAEDFQAATGRGDGRTLDLGDAIGTTMGAVQELADKVDKIEKKVGGRKPRSIREAA